MMDEVGNGYPVCGAGACATLWWCGGARSKNVNRDDRLGAQTVATSRRAPGINYPCLLQLLSDHFIYHRPYILCWIRIIIII